MLEIVKHGIFVVFGLLLAISHLPSDGGEPVAIVTATLLVLRPLAIFVALIGARLKRRAFGAFGGWFDSKPRRAARGTPAPQ